MLPDQALQQPNSGVANGKQQACSVSTHSSSNLRTADLSFNSIDEICDMSHHSNLCVLDLTGNHIQRLGRALEPLRKLRRLHLGSNMLTSCQGLQGTTPHSCSIPLRAFQACMHCANSHKLLPKMLHLPFVLHAAVQQRVLQQH